MLKTVSLFIGIILLSSCGSGKAGSDGTHADTTMAVSEVKAGREIPSFNEDSAYLHISRQVGFGPRVPRTKAHTDCANYIADVLHRAGADTVIVIFFLAIAVTCAFTKDGAKRGALIQAMFFL